MRLKKTEGGLSQAALPPEFAGRGPFVFQRGALRAVIENAEGTSGRAGVLQHRWYGRFVSCQPWHWFLTPRWIVQP
eukprot:3096368-Pyramimonas_sp.AAC.1